MKNLFLIFISISFTLLGCKKLNNNEASQTNNQKYNFKKINFSDVKNDKNLSKAIDIINRKNLSLHNGKNQTDSLFDFVIYFDEGILFDENGKHQYTFPVIRTNPNPNIQENALIIINPSGGIEAYLMRFHLNENDFLSFVNGNTNIQPAIDVIPINYNAYTNKSCYISYSAIYNVLYDDGCCQVIQYVGVDVTFMGDCAGGSGVFNDFGNGYNGPPEGGGGAAIGSFNINNIFSINGSLGLTQQQSNWINSHGFIKMKIFTYLINNNFSQSAKDFAKLIIDNQISNIDDIDFDNCIIYSSSLSSYPFMKNVIKDINNINNPLINTFNNIFNQNVKTNIIYKVSPLSLHPPVYGNTLMNPSGTNSKNFLITFNSGIIDHCTDLLTAATTIHENIHALLIYYKDIGLINGINNSESTLLASLMNYMITTQHYDLGNNQHQIMSSMITLIAETLQDYGISHNINQSLSYYKKLAWTGLTDTPLFYNLYGQPNNYSPQGWDIIYTIGAEAENTAVISPNNVIYYPIGNTP